MVLQVMVDGFWVEIAMTKVEQINFGGVVFHIIHNKQRNFLMELNPFLSILSWNGEQLCSFELKAGIVQRRYVVVGTKYFCYRKIHS